MSKTEQRFGEFGLPVALHSGNCQNLAGLNIKRDAVDCKLLAVVFNMDVFDTQDKVAALLCDRLVYLEINFAANHHGGKFTGGAGGLCLANDLALTNNGDLV